MRPGEVAVNEKQFMKQAMKYGLSSDAIFHALRLCRASSCFNIRGVPILHSRPSVRAEVR